MLKLNDLKVEEIRSIAKENGIALSITIDGKRKRYNKAELITMIENKQQDQTSIEVAPDQVVTDKKELNLNTVVKESKELIRINKFETVKHYITKLNNSIIEEKTNKLLIARMSKILNVLKALLKSNSKGSAIYE